MKHTLCSGAHVKHLATVCKKTRAGSGNCACMATIYMHLSVSKKIYGSSQKSLISLTLSPLAFPDIILNQQQVIRRRPEKAGVIKL